MKEKITSDKKLITVLMVLLACVMPLCGEEIHNAAKQGNLAKVKSILAERPKLVNTQDKRSYTPLHIAAYLGHKDIVEILIANGADVRLEDKDGRCPLHCAVCHDHKQVAEVLITDKADVNAKDKNSRTALHFAASGGKHEIVELLITKGAEVNVKNKAGQTPLHFAVYNGHVEVVKVLVGKGADANSKTKSGWTPLRMAMQGGHGTIADFLRKHGAKVGYESSPTVVGELGDATKLSFEGIKTFTPKKIRDGLVMNPDFLLASHPAAAFSKYLEAAQVYVRTGYQHNGFPEVRVTTGFDKEAEKIMVKVREGARYKCGPVRVLGAKRLPVGWFIHRLTHPWPSPGSITEPPKLPDDKYKDDFFANLRNSPEFFRYIDSTGRVVEPEKPIWKTGEPAPFSDSSLRYLTGRVRNIFSEFGYFFPALELKVVPEANKTTAQLLVEILDEGPKGTIGEIGVTGNWKNKREEILKYLDLKVGMEFNRSLVTKTEYLLWRSARFLDYKVTPEAIHPKEPKLKLNIRLNEYGPAPPLVKGFSPAEKTLLKLYDFLSDLPSGQNDIVLSAQGTKQKFLLQMVVSGQKGILLLARKIDGTAQGDILGAAVLARGKLALFSTSRQRKLVFPEVPGQIDVYLSALPDPDATDGKLFVILPSVGYHSKESYQPFRLNIKLAPVFVSYMVHSEDYTYSRDKEVVTVAGKGFQLKMDAESGRLIELASSKPDKYKYSLTIEKGTFDRLAKEIEDTTASYPNEYKSQEPLSSTVTYLAEEQILHSLFMQSSLFENASPEQVARAATVLAKILDKRPLAPLEALIFKGGAGGGEDFTFPPESPETFEAAMKRVISKISAVVFRYCNDLFPQRSWPWTVAREAVFVTGGKGTYTMTELKRIYESKETGPIGYLVTGKLLSSMKSKSPLVRAFAARGLERLSADDFRNDWRLVLEGESVLTQCLVRTADAFRDLNDEDIEALVAVLPPEQATFVRNSVRLLREGKGKPVGEVLRPALDEYWEKALKKKVKAALQKLTIKTPRMVAAAGPDNAADLLRKHGAVR